MKRPSSSVLARAVRRVALPAILVVALAATAMPSSAQSDEPDLSYAQTTELVSEILGAISEVEGINQLDPLLNPVSDLVLGLTNAIDDVLSNVPLVNTLALQGDDVVDAGIAFSQATYPQGAGTAILAREDLFADAFASGAFQGRFGAPLLFTEQDDLDARTAAELQRLGMDGVAILGGEDALNPLVVTKLQAAGLDVQRIGGPTRVETAIEAAEAAYADATHAVLVRAYPDAGSPDSQAYADLLAAGPFAAENGWPILLTTSDSLHPAVADHLSDFDAVTIIGGESAVSGAVASALTGSGLDVDRISGANRFATAVEIAEARGYSSASEADAIVLAEQGGRDDVWAPGIASTAFGSSNGAPVVLSDGPSLPTETLSFLATDVVDNLLDGGPAVVCAPFVDDSACRAAGGLMLLNLGLVEDLIGTLEGLPLLGDILAALGLAGMLDGILGNLTDLLDGLGLQDTLSGLLGGVLSGDASQLTGLLEGLAGESGTPLDDVLGGLTGDLPLTDVVDDLVGGLGGGLGGGDTPVGDLPVVGDILDGLLGGGDGGGDTGDEVPTDDGGEPDDGGLDIPIIGDLLSNDLMEFEDS